MPPAAARIAAGRAQPRARPPGARRPQPWSATCRSSWACLGSGRSFGKGPVRCGRPHLPAGWSRDVTLSPFLTVSGAAMAALHAAAADCLSVSASAGNRYRSATSGVRRFSVAPHVLRLAAGIARFREGRESPRAIRSSSVRGNGIVDPLTPQRSPSAKPAARMALPMVESGGRGLRHHDAGREIAVLVPGSARTTGTASSLSRGGQTEKSRTPSSLIAPLYGRSGMVGYCRPCSSTVTAVPSATDGARVAGGSAPFRTHCTIASNAARLIGPRLHRVGRVAAPCAALQMRGRQHPVAHVRRQFQRAARSCR